MRGYTKPYVFDDRTVDENVWVGCQRCRNTWHEVRTLFVSSPRVNGCSYMYDYCDACITEDDKQPPPERDAE